MTCVGPQRHRGEKKSGRRVATNQQTLTSYVGYSRPTSSEGTSLLLSPAGPAHRDGVQKTTTRK